MEGVDLRECIKSPRFKNSETNCDHLESRIEMETWKDLKPEPWKTPMLISRKEEEKQSWLRMSDQRGHKKIRWEYCLGSQVDRDVKEEEVITANCCCYVKQEDTENRLWIEQCEVYWRLIRAVPVNCWGWNPDWSGSWKDRQELEIVLESTCHNKLEELGNQ